MVYSANVPGFGCQGRLSDWEDCLVQHATEGGVGPVFRNVWDVLGCVLPPLVLVAFWSVLDGDGEEPSPPQDYFGDVVALLKTSRDRVDFLGSMSKWTAIAAALLVFHSILVLVSLALHLEGERDRTPPAALNATATVDFGELAFLESVVTVQEIWAIFTLVMVALHLRMFRKVALLRMRRAATWLAATGVFNVFERVPGLGEGVRADLDQVVKHLSATLRLLVWLTITIIALLCVDVLIVSVQPLRSTRFLAGYESGAFLVLRPLPSPRRRS